MSLSQKQLPITENGSRVDSKSTIQSSSRNESLVQLTTDLCSKIVNSFVDKCENKCPWMFSNQNDPVLLFDEQKLNFTQNQNEYICGCDGDNNLEQFSNIGLFTEKDLYLDYDSDSTVILDSLQIDDMEVDDKEPLVSDTEIPCLNDELSKLIELSQSTFYPFISQNFQIIPKFNDPLSCFQLLVPQVIFDKIATSSNVHSDLNNNDFNKEISAEEIKNFLGSFLWMSSIENSWKQLDNNARLPNLMKLDRFKQVFKLLFISTSLNTENELIACINDNFMKYSYSTETFLIDEIGVSSNSTGNKIIRQSLNGSTRIKTNKYSLFQLLNSSGYTSRIHLAHNSTQNFPHNYDNILKLCDNYPGPGHTICVDVWHSSIPLASGLLSKGLNFLCKMSMDQIKTDLPLEFRRKLQRPILLFKKNGNNSILSLLKWKHPYHGHSFLGLSNIHNSSDITKVELNDHMFYKPLIVVDFEATKAGALDLIKQMVYFDFSTLIHNAQLNSSCWKLIVLELLTNISVINAYILYVRYSNGTESMISLPSFIKKLSLQLMDSNSEQTRKFMATPRMSDIGKSSFEVKIKKVHQFKKVKSGTYCAKCLNQVKRLYDYTKSHCLRRLSSYYCQDCKSHFCNICINLHEVNGKI